MVVSWSEKEHLKNRKLKKKAIVVISILGEYDSAANQKTKIDTSFIEEKILNDVFKYS